MNRVQHAAIALACVVASTSAMSAAQSSASINNLSFQVIDLDLSNGYNFQFNSQGRTVLSLSTTNNESGESDYFSRNRNGWLVPGSFESDLGFVTGQATVSAQGLSLSGQSLGNGSYSANASSGSDSYWGYGDLSLSANTMVIITAKASVFASATNPSTCSWWYHCSPSESASASAGMSLSYNYYSGNSSVSYSFNESLNASASATGAHTRQEFLGYEIVTDPWGYSYYQPIYQYIDVPMTEGTDSKERTLTAVFVNHSDTTQMARFGLRASINGNATSPLAISPVPEPETWALLLAGLAVVAARVQRTRRAR